MAADWNIYAVRYGTRSTRRSEVFLHHEVYGEPDAPIEMDYFFWVVSRGDDVVVIDTGFDRDVGARRGRTTVVSPMDALGLLDLNAGEVPIVVATHGHYDHIGNLATFDGASVVMARREYDFWTGAVGDRPLFMSAAEPQEIDELRRRCADGSLTLFAESTEIRPGIVVRRVGGHTPGQSVVTVSAAGRTVVLASDAVHYYEELERDRPFAHVVDLEDMYRVFADLRASAREQDTVVVPGHDPLVMDNFERCPGRLADHAVRIA